MTLVAMVVVWVVWLYVKFVIGRSCWSLPLPIPMFTWPATGGSQRRCDFSLFIICAFVFTNLGFLINNIFQVCKVLAHLHNLHLNNKFTFKYLTAHYAIRSSISGSSTF